ncbi:MAG: hypothetical protein U0Q15_09110 [Kineosporiaceae bacterium]
MTSRWRADDAWTVLARRQDHVVAWHQLREWGWTLDDARRPVDSGHWRRLEPGIFATTTAPLSARGLVWPAVLATRGVACGATALWLAGLDKGSPPAVAPVEIAVDWTRRLRADHPSRTVHRHRDLASAIRRGADVPRVQAEVGALEVCGRLQREEDAVALVLAVVQQRLCTVEELGAALAAHPRARRRGLIGEMVASARDGVANLLELRFARDVERRHGLPTAKRNHDLGTPGAPQVVDNWYEEFGVVVELDGQVAHPTHLAFRDHSRDNRSVVRGRIPLRYGWFDVAGRPCAVAVQLAGVFRSRGCDGLTVPVRARVPRALSGWSRRRSGDASRGMSARMLPQGGG